MTRKSFKIFLAVLMSGVFLTQTVFAETETATENPSIEIPVPQSTDPPLIDDNGDTVTTEAPETQPAPEKPARDPALVKEDGLVFAGVASLFYNNTLLSEISPYLTDAEKDWELRATAVASYENFGISQVDSYLNVRDKASTDGNVIGKMTNHNACEILEKSDDGKWLKIKSGEVTGYVSSDYILTGYEAKDLGKAEAFEQVVINTATLNVRSDATEDASIWTQVSGNERYDFVKNVGDWIEIELDSSTGYVAKDYVSVAFGLNTAVKYTPPKEEIENTLRDRIVSYAMQYLGGRYVWGGTSLTKGVDCSGFTMKVYQHFGIYMSHYSGSQAYEGTKISRSQLKKGDLVFYAKNGTINHVAIYIGDGMVIHARSTRRGICITDMYYRTPVRYVRFISE